MLIHSLNSIFAANKGLYLVLILLVGLAFTGCVPSEAEQNLLTATAATAIAAEWTKTPTATTTLTPSPTATQTPTSTQTSTSTRTATPTRTITPSITPTHQPIDLSEYPGKLVYITFDCNRIGLGICIDLEVLELSTLNSRKITEHDTGMALSPRWSPDGRYVVYTFYTLGENGVAQLRAYDFRANLTRILTPEGLIENAVGISFSPDGRFLVYGDGEGDNKDIYLVNLRAPQPVNLTSDYTGWDAYPSWSPDGEWIAFTSDRPLNKNSAGGVDHIWVMKTDGTQLSSLVPDASMDNQDFQPAWSPDSERIAFLRGPAAGKARGAGSSLIIYYTKDGRGRVNELLVFDDPFTQSDVPAWSPNGQRIAASVGSEEQADLWLVEAYGTRHNKLNTIGGRHTDPSWAPDSRALAYDYGGDEMESCFVIFVFDEDGWAFINSPGDYGDPAWGP